MVKIRNVFGDINTGRQDNAVYQRKYGQGMRRLYKETKPATSPLQKEQHIRFQQAIQWIQGLSKEEKESAKQYCRDNNIGSNIGEPIHWYNWLKNFGLKKPNFKLIDDTTNTVQVSHPGIYSFEELDKDGDVVFSVDELSDLKDKRFVGLYEQKAKENTEKIRITTLSGSVYEYAVSPLKQPIWYSDWKWYQELIVTGGSIDIYSYTLPSVVVPYNPKMNVDFSDIRFLDEEDNIIPQYMVSKTNGVTATFRLLIPDVPISPNVAKYKMIYGNPDATLLSDISTVYLLYEDFDYPVNTPIDPTKFNAVYRSNNSVISHLGDGRLHLNNSLGGGQGCGIVSKDYFKGPIDFQITYEMFGSSYPRRNIFLGFGSGDVSGITNDASHNFILASGYGMETYSDSVQYRYVTQKNLDPSDGIRVDISSRSVRLAYSAIPTTHIRQDEDGNINLSWDQSNSLNSVDTDFIDKLHRVYFSTRRFMNVVWYGQSAYVSQAIVKNNIKTPPAVAGFNPENKI